MIVTNLEKQSNHIKSVHDKIKDHLCNQCNFAFSLKSDLDRHVEGVHKEKRKFRLKSVTNVTTGIESNKD